MFNRRVIREVKTYHRDLFSVIPLRLIASFMLLSTVIFSQTNNQQYELNDPRNPDCPCHKLQKQAEDEYKQMQLNNNIGNQLAMNINKEKLNDLDNNNNNEGNDQLSDQSRKNFEQDSQNSGFTSSGSGTIRKRKNVFSMFEKKRNVFKMKHSKIKKFRIKNATCYHWD